MSSFRRLSSMSLPTTAIFSAGFWPSSLGTTRLPKRRFAARARHLGPTWAAMGLVRLAGRLAARRASGSEVLATYGDAILDKAWVHLPALRPPLLEEVVRRFGDSTDSGLQLLVGEAMLIVAALRADERSEAGERRLGGRSSSRRRVPSERAPDLTTLTCVRAGSEDWSALLLLRMRPAVLWCAAEPERRGRLCRRR